MRVKTEQLRYYFDFLLMMTQKELKVRYKNTVFGFLWVIVNPLLQMIIVGFVFRFFIKEPIKNYYLYLLVGLLVWNFFSLSLTKATSSIVNERSLIRKAKFPREVIPMSIVLSNFIHLLIAFILLVILEIFTGTFSFIHLNNLLLGFLMLLTFTIGFSLFTSALNVRYRDVNFFIQALLIIWFYLTPIVYSVNFIPREFIWIWRLNPMTAVVQFFQNALTSAPGPGLAMFSINFSIILIIAFIGIITFNREGKNFDDWL